MDQLVTNLAIIQLPAQTLARWCSSVNVYSTNEYMHEVDPSQKCRWQVIFGRAATAHVNSFSLDSLPYPLTLL